MTELPADGIHRVELRVQQPWLDGDGQLTRGGYLRLFDDAGEALTLLAGMGSSYTAATHQSWVALESHFVFHAPLAGTAVVRIDSRVVDLDSKKLHLAQAMFEDDSLVATHEQLGLHFNTQTRRGCAFDAAVHARLVALCRAQAAAPAAAWLARRIAVGID